MSRLTCSDAEWATRCELAALYRLIAHFGMTDLIETHITARVPGSDGHFLINRYGLLFGEMHASALVKIDAGGRVVEPGGDPASMRINEAGFVIHSAVHAARADLHWVIHTHTAAGCGVSAQKQGLMPISQHALRFHRRIGYHDYEGIALDTDERTRLVADLGSHRALILRNHGLLVGASTAAEAFSLIFYLENACKIQIAALTGGTPLCTPSEAVCERTARQFESPGELSAMQLSWEAALRLISDGANDYSC